MFQTFQTEEIYPPNKLKHVSDISKNTSLVNPNILTFFRENITFDARSCSISASVGGTDIQTPFKIYIYNLPNKFNTDVQTRLMARHPECYSFEYCGSGARLFDIGDGVTVYDSHQFSLEVLIHHLLALSPYRTLDPNKADYFYIPAYIGLQCLLHNVTATRSLIEELFTYLNSTPYFINGKPQFSSLGKIEHEMRSKGSCPYLLHPNTVNITFLSIERALHRSALGQRVISVPYPSYIHLTRKNSSIQNLLAASQRKIFILLAASTRRSIRYRNIIMDQFTEKTTLSYEQYTRHKQNSTTPMVMLITRECAQKPRYYTVPWMLHSVFCLQPPGDSPTRKSFYDSLLSGCIPVLFPYPNHPSAWAFQNHFNFSKFTVTIPYNYMHSKTSRVYDFLSNISPVHVDTLQKEVWRVAPWYQYGIPDGAQSDQQDAMTMIHKDLVSAFSRQ